MSKSVTGNKVIQCEICGKDLKNTPKSLSSHMGYWHKDYYDGKRKSDVKFKLKCEECGEYVANTNNVLARHIHKIHNIPWVDYLIKHQHNGVHPVCICGCGRKVKWHLGGFCKYALKSCSSKGSNNGMYGLRGVESPNFGKVRTEEMKEKYRNAALTRDDSNRIEIMRTSEYREKQRESQLESYQNSDHAEKISKALNNFWKSDPRAAESRKKASERAIVLLEQGKIGPQAPFKAEWIYNPFTNQNEYMHSSWETIFLSLMIELNKPITKSHSLRVQYIDTHGIERTYVPDFVGFDTHEGFIYEVKGRMTDEDALKLEALKAWADQNEYEIFLVDKDYLMEFNLI